MLIKVVISIQYQKYQQSYVYKENMNKSISFDKWVYANKVRGQK